MSATAECILQPSVKPVESFLPTTFLERGVAVPFTTPQLCGARARPGERKPLELVVANPSGGRGVYIIAWANILDFCKLSMNDRRLIDAIAKLHGVTPDAIRHVSRDVAAEGLAGRGVVAAAQQAQKSDDLARLQANFDLLIELVRQTEPKSEDLAPPEQARPAELEYRGRRAVARVAFSLGCTPDGAATALEQLATAFQGTGVRHSARIPREIEKLTRVRQAIIQFAEANPTVGTNEASLLSNAADLTIMLANATLADALALTSDIKALLRKWTCSPEAITQLLSRPDWLLDGWNRICALWLSAPELEQTLIEMAALVPVVPREADQWLSYRAGRLVNLPQYRGKVVRQLEDWRTGVTVADLVARNEVLLEKTL